MVCKEKEVKVIGRAFMCPILTTAIDMIVDMLPIAVTTGAGAEVKNGMAWVIISGLLSSLILTLVQSPVCM